MAVVGRDRGNHVAVAADSRSAKLVIYDGRVSRFRCGLTRRTGRNSRESDADTNIGGDLVPGRRAVVRPPIERAGRQRDRITVAREIS